MKIFLTGATGYIGGSVGLELIDAGHSVHGLVRSPARAALLEKAGIHPVFGSLEDADIVGKAAREADTVINAANSDHFEVHGRYMKDQEGMWFAFQDAFKTDFPF